MQRYGIHYRMAHASSLPSASPKCEMTQSDGWQPACPFKSSVLTNYSVTNKDVLARDYLRKFKATCNEPVAACHEQDSATGGYVFACVTHMDASDSASRFFCKKTTAKIANRQTKKRLTIITIFSRTNPVCSHALPQSRHPRSQDLPAELPAALPATLPRTWTALIKWQPTGTSLTRLRTGVMPTDPCK